MHTTGTASWLALALFASAAGAQQGSIQVEEIASTKGSPSAPFGTIGDMLEVSAGLVAVADDMGPSIHLWDVSDNSFRTLARSGDGPGEVRTPVQLARRPGGGLGVYDLGHSAVLLFDSTLDFERRILLGAVISNPKDFALLAGDTSVVAGGRLSDPKHLQRYSAAGERLDEWGDPVSSLERSLTRIQVAGGALRVGGDGSLLFGFAAPYRIVRFASSDLEQPEIVTEDLELVPEPTDDELMAPGPGPGSVAFRWWFDRTTAVLELDDGRILTIVTRVYEEDSVWSLHAPEGRLLARSALDRAWDVHDRMADGRVVASYRDPDTDERIAVILRVEIE